MNNYNDTGYDIQTCYYKSVDMGNNLLQALWQVAIEITKEEICLK